MEEFEEFAKRADEELAANDDVAFRHELRSVVYDDRPSPDEGAHRWRWTCECGWSKFAYTFDKAMGKHYEHAQQVDMLRINTFANLLTEKQELLGWRGLAEYLLAKGDKEVPAFWELHKNG